MENTSTAGGIILIIVGLVATAYGSQILNPPKIIGIYQTGTTEFCPSQLKFLENDNRIVFSVMYSNKADTDGIFNLNLSSNEVLSRVFGTSHDFETSSTFDNRFIGSDEVSEFKFELKLPVSSISNPPEIVNIFLKLDCRNNLANTISVNCGTDTRTCSYNLDKSKLFQASYNLRQ